MRDVILSFKNVGLAYRRNISPFSKKNWVINDISFDLYRGEVLGVIGKNGAGKSTLLKLLADIMSENKGEIVRAKNLRSQLLTLALGFNVKLSGYDNAVIASVMLGKTIKEAKSIIPKIVEFAEIEHLMDHAVSTYSAGEKARLGFAIAMETSPDLLLLDEILSVGDKDFKVKSSKALKERILSDQTAILVSHNPHTLLEFCERILWLEGGKVRMLGAAKEVSEAYNAC